MTLAALGDDRAFAELVRRRQSTVRGMLRRLSGDATLADDLAQETFVQAWRTLSQLRNAGAFGGWLKQVAVRVWLQHARRTKLPLDPLEDAENMQATDVTGCIDRWLTARAAMDDKLRRAVAADAARRLAFLRYYALRASSAFSSGAHDEWNILVRINHKRPLGDQVAVFFDGRPASPAEMEVDVSPGYELR